MSKKNRPDRRVPGRELEQRQKREARKVRKALRPVALGHKVLMPESGTQIQPKQITADQLKPAGQGVMSMSVSISNKPTEQVLAQACQGVFDVMEKFIEQGIPVEFIMHVKERTPQEEAVYQLRLAEKHKAAAEQAPASHVQAVIEKLEAAGAKVIKLPHTHTNDGHGYCSDCGDMVMPEPDEPDMTKDRSLHDNGY